MRGPPKRFIIPWGFVCLALGTGVIVAMILPAVMVVFLLALIFIAIGVLLIC